MEGADNQVDVNAFPQYSLSTQNRRKSRMGKALDNDLEAIFNAWEWRCDTQVRTKTGNRADFISPGRKESFIIAGKWIEDGM